MGRQLFLHHYLPAHLASSMVTGALLEFVFNLDPIELAEPVTPSDKIGKKKCSAPSYRGTITSYESPSGQSVLALWAVAGVVLAVVIGGWYFFLPLTYGKPGLDVAQVNARKWMGYDLHFAK